MKSSLIDWESKVLIDLVGWEKEEKKSMKRAKTIEYSFSQKQKTNKREKRKRKQTKEKKETIQSNSRKRQKSIENNRTEQKRKETKEKLLKSQQINQTIHLIWFWFDLIWESNVKLNYQKVILKYETKRNQTIELNLSNVSSFFGCFLEFWWIEKKQKHTKLKLLFSNQNKSQRNKQTFEWLNERTNERIGWLVGFLKFGYLIEWKRKENWELKKGLRKEEKSYKSLNDQATKQANKWLVWIGWFWLKRKIEQWQRLIFDTFLLIIDWFVDCIWV